MIRSRAVLYYLLYGGLLVDTVNGVILRSYEFSISAVYKGLILFLVCVLAGIRIKDVLVVSMLASCLFFHWLYAGEVVAGQNFDWAIKFFFIYILYHFFSVDMKVGREEKIYNLAKISFAVLALNLIIGSFGYGYAQYQIDGVSVGTRGFLYAGNEISIALACSSGIIMSFLLVNNKRREFLVFSIFAAFISALSTMKVSVLSILLLFVLLPPLTNRGNRGWRVSRTTVSVVLLLPVLIGVVLYYVVYETEQLSRLNYFYEKNGLLSLIFSYRNIWAGHAFSIFMEYEWLQVIFGSGQLWVLSMPHNGIVEIDPVDVLMTFGVVGVLIVYGFFFMGLLSLSAVRNNPYRGPAFLMFLLVLGVSSTAGHVVFSGIAAPLIASALSFVRYERKMEGAYG